MEKDAIDLGTVPVGRLFRKYFVPTLLGMLSMSAVTAIDGIFVGHGIGSNGIAAINIIAPIYLLCTGLGLMTGMGCSVVASIHMARGKLKTARINVTQALLFVSIVSAATSALMFAFPDRTGLLLGSSEGLLPMVRDYIIWFVPAMTFQVLVSVGLFVIRLDGAPRLAMWCSLIASVANAILDYIFIFPLNWGMKGVAFASALSLAIGGITVLVYILFFARRMRAIRLKMSLRSLRYSLRNIGYQCRIGASGLLGECTIAAFILVGNLVFMHYLGDDGVGAFGIACYYTPFVFMFGNAISQSAQPIVSYNFGRGNRDRVKATLNIALATGVVSGIMVTALFTFFPELLVGLFVELDNAAADIAVEGFPYFSAAFMCFLLNLVFIGYFQSVERLRPATWYALLRGFIFLIPSFLLLPLAKSPEGIWLALCLSETLTTLVIVIPRLPLAARRKAEGAGA